jgi:hypothetical protein
MYVCGDVEGEDVKISNLVGDLSERRLEHRKETLSWPTLNRCQSHDLTLCLLLI